MSSSNQRPAKRGFRSVLRCAISHYRQSLLAVCTRTNRSSPGASLGRASVSFRVGSGLVIALRFYASMLCRQKMTHEMPGKTGGGFQHKCTPFVQNAESLLGSHCFILDTHYFHICCGLWRLVGKGFSGWGKVGVGIATLIVLGRKGPHGFPFRRAHWHFPIH